MSLVSMRCIVLGASLKSVCEAPAPCLPLLFVWYGTVGFQLMCD